MCTRKLPSYPAGEFEVGGCIGGGAIDTDSGGSNIDIYYIYEIEGMYME